MACTAVLFEEVTFSINLRQSYTNSVFSSFSVITFRYQFDVTYAEYDALVDMNKILILCWF